MTIRPRHAYITLRIILLSLILAGCASTTASPVETTPPPQPTPSLAAMMRPTGSPLPTQPPLQSADVTITVGPIASGRPISPLIYGMSGAPPQVQREVRPTLASWGGNPSTRYNWRLGNAWNTARDWYYINTNYDYTGASSSDDFVAEATAGGAEVRIALPTLGWVAKNTDQKTCSFPSPSGECGDADKASCDQPGPIADPRTTSVPSDVESIVSWVKHLRDEKGYRVRFFAMDNEPELWGITHYDVHPECTTYEEIRDKYLAYSSAVRAAAPDAELLGPVTCCWYFYWNSAAGTADKRKHGSQDFLPWFLDEVRAHDQRTGVKTLDVLDIHYYPEGVYNDKDDSTTAALRLRSTRSLWDPSYVDESWIRQPVMLIPRMLKLIDEHYPGVKLGITEWNWGADKTMNGALAIADVLGIFGREGVYLASYWRSPEPGSPGMYAFKLYANYDGAGSRFAGLSLPVDNNDADWMSAYAAVDQQAGLLRLMLVNKNTERTLDAAVALPAELHARGAQLYRYSAAAPDRLVHEPYAPGQKLALPASSITLVVFDLNRS